MHEMWIRFWDDLAGRVTGPMTFRLILQPIVAVLLAIRAGWKDACEGKVPYGWSLLTDPAHRRALLAGGWKDVSRVFVVAIVLDVIYQLIVLHWVYPLEAIVVALVLAILPYLFVRGVVTRLVRAHRRRYPP